MKQQQLILAFALVANAKICRATDYSSWVVHPEFDDKEELEHDELFQDENIQVVWDDDFESFVNQDFDDEEYENVGEMEEELGTIDDVSPRHLRLTVNNEEHDGNERNLAPSDIIVHVLESVNNLRRTVGLEDGELPPVRLQDVEPLTFDCKPKQPTSSNMRELTWDDELASSAKKWSENCRNSLNPDMKDFGEIRYIRYTTDPANDDFVQAAIDKWSSQSVNYNYQRSRCEKGACGSFVQLVRDKASRIGCAVNKCSRISGPGGKAKEANFMVCYLDSKRSFRRPYRAGRQCALCPTSCREGLCQRKAQIYRACKDYTGPYPICRITWNGVRHDTCASLWEQAGTRACSGSSWVREYYCRLSCGTCDPSESDTASSKVCGTAIEPPDPCSDKKTYRGCTRVKKGPYIRLCNWVRKSRKCQLRDNIPYLTGI